MGPYGTAGGYSRSLEMDNDLEQFHRSVQDIGRIIARSRESVRESVELLERISAMASPLITTPPGHRKDGRDRLPDMDRGILEEHLAQAERHVAQGEKHVAKQRAIVAELERDGHDTVAAHDLLRQFEELQALHVADCDRLRSELGAA